MPLSINVGLSRKASKDYQSTGISINLTAELDQSLLAQPEQLQQKIHALYHQARQALQREAQPPGPAPADLPKQAPSPPTNGHGSPMTASQKRAITAIAARAGVQVAAVAASLGLALNALSVRQASQLIDHLQSLPLAGVAPGR